MTVVKWRFRDYHETATPPHTWVWPINPNEGGSPTVNKTIHAMTNAGTRNVGILQEGPMEAPVLNFSGVILTQQHYEEMERWYDRRILIELTDDLGRMFLGIFTSFTPQRQRRPFNPWYHTYQAAFTVWAYKNASGHNRYGRWPNA